MKRWELIDEKNNMKQQIILKILNRAKKYLKTNDTMKQLCKDYNVDIDVIDLIPIKFAPLDVSARTDHGVITLNEKLLKDGDFFKDYSYLIHEISHYFQQCFNDKPTQSADDGDYLDNKYEQEGFNYQLDYISDEFGDSAANKYVEQVLDHHKITGPEDREYYKNILLKL